MRCYFGRNKEVGVSGCGVGFVCISWHYFLSDVIIMIVVLRCMISCVWDGVVGLNSGLCRLRL